MPAREVSDAERWALVRRNIKNAAEITEAFRWAFEDSLPLDQDRAIAMLDELKNCLESAHVDAYASGEQSFELWEVPNL